MRMCKYQHLRCNCVTDSEPFIASQTLILMTFTLQTWKDGATLLCLFYYFKVFPSFSILVGVHCTLGDFHYNFLI